MIHLYYSIVSRKNPGRRWCSNRGSGDRAVIAFAMFDARQIDPFQEHDEVRGADPDARLTLERQRKAVPSGFESLVPERVPVLLPQQELDPVGGLVSEDEDVPRERIASEPFPDHGGQTVERFSKIDR